MVTQGKEEDLPLAVSDRRDASNLHLVSDLHSYYNNVNGNVGSACRRTYYNLIKQS
jgi:hypothetical protein